MLPANRQKLRWLLDTQFGRGINKKDLFEVLVKFIDYNYPTTTTRMYFTSRLKNEVLHELALDIRDSGGLDKWKKKVQTFAIPIVGTLSPSKKKKEQKSKDNNSC